MSSIQRQLPQTIEGRLMALSSAVDKEAHLPPGVIIITSATKTRMININTIYIAAVQTTGIKTAASTGATRVKNEAQNVSRMWTSHYFQALNNAIDRDDYEPEVRSFFLLPVGSDAAPVMDNEEKVKLWGERVRSGETAMIAAGNSAMPYPSEPDVTLKVNDFKTKLTAQSTAADAADIANEAVDGHNEEADKVIKKIWDEVETFYNEETVESMRENAREWGVKYITLGDPTAVTFKAERSDTHAGIEAAEFKIISTGNIYDAGPDGTVEIETRLIGDELVKATHPDYTAVEQNITIVEGVGMTVVFTMVPL